MLNIEQFSLDAGRFNRAFTFNSGASRFSPRFFPSPPFSFKTAYSGGTRSRGIFVFVKSLRVLAISNYTGHNARFYRILRSRADNVISGMRENSRVPRENRVDFPFCCQFADSHSRQAVSITHNTLGIIFVITIENKLPNTSISLETSVGLEFGSLI